MRKNRRRGPAFRLAGEEFSWINTMMTIGAALFFYYKLLSGPSPAITSLASFFAVSLMVVIPCFIYFMAGSSQNKTGRASDIKLTERHMRPFLAVVGSCIALSIIFGIMGW